MLTVSINGGLLALRSRLAKRNNTETYIAECVARNIGDDVFVSRVAVDSVNVPEGLTDSVELLTEKVEVHPDEETTIAVEFEASREVELLKDNILLTLKVDGELPQEVSDDEG